MAVTLVDYVTQLKNSPGTDAQISAAIWSNATRSLTVDPATDAGAATLVWNHAGRTLTGVGVSMTPVSLTNQAVPAAAFVDLRPAAGKFRYASFGITGAQTVSWALGHYDGVTLYPEQIVNSVTQALLNGTIGNPAFGFYALNNGISTGNFNLSGFDWSA